VGGGGGGGGWERKPVTTDAKIRVTTLVAGGKKPFYYYKKRVLLPRASGGGDLSNLGWKIWKDGNQTLLPSMYWAKKEGKGMLLGILGERTTPTDNHGLTSDFSQKESSLYKNGPSGERPRFYVNTDMFSGNNLRTPKGGVPTPDLLSSSGNPKRAFATRRSTR